MTYRTEADKIRKAWKARKPQRCMRCGRKPTWPPLAVHEIERRSHAPKRYAHPSNFLLICQSCHTEFDAAPHAEQLAVKSLSDPADYDLQAWLRLADPDLRAPNRVTQGEVDSYKMTLAI